MRKVWFLLMMCWGLVAITPAQSVFPGTDLPEMVKLDDLPEDYAPVQLGCVQGQSVRDGLLELVLLSSSESNTEVARLSRLASVSWTRGELVDLYGKKMLVTYSYEIPRFLLMDFENDEAASDIWMVLKLVAQDSILSSQPIPGLTREKFRAMVNDEEGLPRMQVQEGSVRTQGLSNIKQMGTALQIYLADYDDLYPRVDSTPALRGVVYPYTRSKDIFRSMNPSGRGEIYYNVNVGGTVSTAIERVSRFVVLFDPTPWPDGMFLVGFADSSARFVTAEEWAELQKEMRVPLPKSGPVVKVPESELIFLEPLGTGRGGQMSLRI